MIFAYAAIVIALVIVAALYLEWLHRSFRHSEIERLIDEYAELTRKHAPREHVRRQLVELQCRELVS